MNNRPRRKSIGVQVALALAAAGSLVAIDASARITKIQITSTTPAYNGVSIGAVGPYERVVGKAFGELDPNNPLNSVIVDIGLAPRNANGKVEYSMDFYILKPVDMTKGSDKMFYEPPNRGGKQYATFNRSTGGNDPATSTNPQNTFLAPRGYTMVWSGWDFAAGTDNSNFNTTITLPVAKNADGTSITGPAYEYIVLGTGVTSYTLNYAAASADQTKATLTWRKHLDDVPQPVAATGWAYTDATNSAIKLTTGAFNANDIYEFSYTAKDPTVNGVGFAAVRDFNSFLRNAQKDDVGTANPLANHVKSIYTFISSQPGRMLNDFRWLGFNQDESGNKVFDAMMQWISAGDGINMNLRFSQPGRTERNRQDQLYDEGHFPFAHATMKDAITGKTDGRYAKCTATNTCPLGMEVYSANEYWVKGASLFHTTPDGKTDLADHPQARIYFISSHQHGVGNGTSKGLCQQLGNPLNVFPTMRALWVAMDAWATSGTLPPASQHPTLADKTMVAPLPQSGVGFPNIPGVQYTGLKTTRYLWNYGPRFQQGIMDINPPVYTQPFFDNPANGQIYPTYVPTTDNDGNDIAGLRLLDVVVPLATYTGWSLRSIANDGPDGCEGSGQMIPFPMTAAARAASGDPRLSVAERYGSFSGYYYARLFATEHQLDQGYLLTEDAFTEFTRGLQSAQHDYSLKDEAGDE